MERGIKYRCLACSHQFRDVNPIFACPTCDSKDILIRGEQSITEFGYALEIDEQVVTSVSGRTIQKDLPSNVLPSEQREKEHQMREIHVQSFSAYLDRGHDLEHIKEMADHLGKHPNTVKYYLRNKDRIGFPAVKVGRTWRSTTSSLDAWRLKHKK